MKDISYIDVINTLLFVAHAIFIIVNLNKTYANPWRKRIKPWRTHGLFPTKQERDEMFARTIWMNAVVIPSVCFVRFLEQCIAGDIALGPVLVQVFLAITAGTFICLGTVQGFKHMIRGNGSCRPNHYACVIVGFLLLAIVAIWL